LFLTTLRDKVFGMSSNVVIRPNEGESAMMSALFVSAAVAVLICLFPNRSSASDNSSDSDTGDEKPPTYYGTDHIDAKAVGITGGVIGGAEAVMAVQAAFGVDKWWMYVLFPALGAGAGGVGGYYLEKASTPGAVALLVTAVAAIIPTAILTTSAFAYDPEKAGAVKADTMDDGRYSFEKPPEEMPVPANETGETKTEVEASPEVGPPVPPAPAESPPEQPTLDGSSIEQPQTDISPEEAPTPLPATPDNQAEEPTSSRPKDKQKRMAGGPPSGTLLHVRRDGAVSFSVPYVDVVPAGMSPDRFHPDGEHGQAFGIEVHIPLVRVDLP
jgi:hypothetical protein